MMSGSRRIMHYVRLGQIAYAPALTFQQMCAKAVMSGKSQPNGADGVLLVLEHDPVYTVGLRSDRYPDNVADDLRRLGADFQRTNRGGLITFHGPGQLVVYPILHLRHWGLGVKSYVEALEHAIIRACGAVGVYGERSAKYTGVWIGRNKIAAIGGLLKFLPRDAMLARYMPSAFVCVSVTLRYCIKMAKQRITQKRYMIAQ